MMAAAPASSPSFVVLLLLISSFSTIFAAKSCNPACKVWPPFDCNDTSRLNADGFPKGFFFGGATSSYQIEGAEERGSNIWDVYTHRYAARTKDNGDRAIDSYHLYENDVELLKGMGANAYRFSISWSRLLPRGKVSKGINMKGVQYYNKLIDKLKENGIEPFVTLYHWDLPTYLDDEYGGFLSPKIVDDFTSYAELCFLLFGDRVKYWITLNQPYSVASKGYGSGSYPPGRCSAWNEAGCDDGGDSGTEPYLAAHHQILSHAKIVKVYRDRYQPYQKGKIGTTLITRWFVPLNKTEGLDETEDPIVKRAFDFFVGWFLEPLTKGDYPQSMKDTVGDRLPKFTTEEKGLVKGSLDFLGLNYYFAQYVYNSTKADPSRLSCLTDGGIEYTYVKDGKPIGPAALGYYYYPPGLNKVLDYVRREWGKHEIYITENGFKSNASESMKDTLNDQGRIEYHCSHLACLKCAIEDGHNIKGYFAWSSVDNFEFGDGYGVRFGFNYVDYNNVTDRRPKASARWFKSFTKRRQLGVSDI